MLYVLFVYPKIQKYPVASAKYQSLWHKGSLTMYFFIPLRKKIFFLNHNYFFLKV